MSLNKGQKDIAGLLAEWREITDNPEVTAAPWNMEEDWAYIASGSDSVIHGYYEDDCPACGDEIQDNASVALSGEDAAFIVTSRTAMPALLAAVENVLRIEPCGGVCACGGECGCSEVLDEVRDVIRDALGGAK